MGCEAKIYKLIISLQDHRPECPMCKTSLQADGTSNWGVNEFVEQSIKRLFPLDLLERRNGFEEDQMNEANVPSEIRSKAVYHRRRLITMIIL